MRRAKNDNPSNCCHSFFARRVPFKRGAFFFDLPSDLIPRLFPFLQSPFRSSGAGVFGV